MIHKVKPEAEPKPEPEPEAELEEDISEEWIYTLKDMRFYLPNTVPILNI